MSEYKSCPDCGKHIHKMLVYCWGCWNVGNKGIKHSNQCKYCGIDILNETSFCNNGCQHNYTLEGGPAVLPETKTKICDWCGVRSIPIDQDKCDSCIVRTAKERETHQQRMHKLEFEGVDTSEVRWWDWEPKHMESFFRNQVDIALITNDREEFMKWSENLKRLKEGHIA